MPNYDKYVPFVTTKPIEYKSVIGGEHGDEISFDVKVKVLSSHHEDNFFRLHFQVWDPLEKSPFKPVSVVSAAIKVISKPLKPKTPKPKGGAAKPRVAAVKRKAADFEGDEESDPDEMLVDSPARAGASSSSPSLAALEATLSTVAQQQRETLDLLQQLSDRGSPNLMPSGGPQSAPSLTGSSDSVGGPPPPKRARLDIPPTPDDFEGSFSVMLQAYAGMSPELKAEKVRRLVRGLPTRDGETLEELFDVLATQGVRVQTGTTFAQPHQHTEACGPECPHREELQRMEDFFNEVFY